jgi:cell wall-associated NlpC family hydrolase
MKDIKTRPKTKEIKLRDAAAIAPRELSKAIKETSAAKILNNHPQAEEKMGREESPAVNGTLQKIEADSKSTIAYTAQKAYSGGKAIAQKSYDSQFRTSKYSNKGNQTDHPEGNGQSDFVKATKEYHKEKAKQAQKRGGEIKVKSEQAKRVITDGDLKTVSSPGSKTIPQSIKLKDKEHRSSVASTAGNAKRAYAQWAKANAVREMQKEMVKDTGRTAAKATKTVAKGTSRIAQAVARVGRAIVKALVGLLGGAGELIVLVLIIGGAAAVIATPFGVFWSGQDKDAMTMPMAVAQINAEFEAKLSSIEKENSADRVKYNHLPDGGYNAGVSNWPEVVAVFACKTAGADADAADVVTMDEERISLLSDVFWDMNSVSYAVETITHTGIDNEAGYTERVLHITIKSRTYEEMMEYYDFSSNQREALQEMMKPEYTQMLAELVGTPAGETVLTTEQINELLKNVPVDLSADRLAVLKSAFSLCGKVSYFWGGKSYAIGWDDRWGETTKVTSPGSRTTGTIQPYGLDCSGFVDWAFYNGIGRTVGTGGGTYDQYAHSRKITFSEALPGDIVFFSDLSHVGIYAGFNENGQPIVIQCGSKGVAVTSLSIFSIIARPNILE